jgi:hypothetical protein
MAKLAAPSGFRDFLPDEHRKRQELIGRIRASYESFGFEGMDTSAMVGVGVGCWCQCWCQAFVLTYWHRLL